jgi:WD40 repeat protein
MVRSDRRWRPLGPILSGLGLLVAGTGQALAQAEARNPTQPVLVYQTGGHSAPVQALAFTPDGAQLLSGGMDRLVNVWMLNDGPPRLSRTLRPPIWRGRRGAVYALALAPVAAEGQRFLAVAGYGVESQYGNIGLYRYPGRNGLPTGDIVAQLPSGEAVAAPAGHTNVVRCLAFDPTGRYLASGSNDRTVRIWDVPARRTVAVLAGHTGPVTSLAFAFSGRRMFTAGPDGSILLWDVRPATLVPLADPNAQPAPRAPLFRLAAEPRPGASGGEAIKALTVADDGRRIVVGRQDGWLALLAATEQAVARQAWLPLRDPPAGATRGEVLAMAFSPDGRRLAVSRLARGLARLSDPLDPRSEVEVRGGADLGVTAVAAASDLVNVCAFNPDGKLLAFAGGSTQTVSLRDAANPARVVADLSGSGSSLWDVGFTADSRALGFSWAGPGEAAPAVFWGYELRRRAVTSFNRDDLRRAQTVVDGWTLSAVDPFTIEARDAAGAAARIALNAAVDGRWWSFTWIPPLPGSHPAWAVAVGTDSGNVVVFALDEARRAFTRTRVLAGPAAAVRAVAPSPDGKWLAGGSADQAIRLWTLAGCDTVPPLGASFAPGPDGRIVVSAVTPRGTAEAMGLKAGDVVERSFIGVEKVDPPALAARIAAEPQGVRLDLEVRRGAVLVAIGTSRRDNPALSLFVATDQEWVLWMPQGYYETSIAGDRRFLGWHRNASRADGTGVDLARPTDYFSVDRFENELRRPAVLDRLLEVADIGQALDLVAAAQRDVPGLVATNPPPAVALEAPGLTPDRPLVVAVPDLALQARAATEVLAAGRKAIRRLRVLIDARTVYEPALQPPPPEVDRRVALTLPPGRHRVSLIATDDRGQERTDAFDVDYQPPPERPAPPPGPRAPRLLVLAIGAGNPPGGVFPKNPAIPAIPYAAEDARDLGGFLAGPRVQRFKAVDARSLGRFGAQPADSTELHASLDRLDSDRAKGDLTADDTVIVALESHVIRHLGRDYVLPTDAGPGTPPARALAAGELVDRLAALADYGCRVFVLVDGVHDSEAAPPGWASRADDLVRSLYKRNVIVFTATIQGPSRRLVARGHGAFAEAILTTTPPPAGTIWTLDDLATAVVEGVANLTQRRQTARLYVPGVYPGDRISIFEPSAPASARATP